MRIADLVIHRSAWIGRDMRTSGDEIDGPAIGHYGAGSIAGRVIGAVRHLEFPEQLAGEPHVGRR
ncbi:MAG TPA: hypothetical protein VFS08_07225 [Gemmatimonadaceae bacterium]|nr:hypothetical protein [Gemmatimonadaceae bacterium]